MEPWSEPRKCRCAQKPVQFAVEWVLGTRRTLVREHLNRVFRGLEDGHLGQSKASMPGSLPVFVFGVFCVVGGVGRRSAKKLFRKKGSRQACTKQRRKG